MHNLKKYALWAAVAAFAYHLVKKTDDEVRAQAEPAFNPQD
jgi:hypothetical protein